VFRGGSVFHMQCAPKKHPFTTQFHLVPSAIQGNMEVEYD
jgi:hypothetical protein